MSETDLTQARLWDLYKECEGRIGPSFLTILLVSVIYWLSFLLFVFDPQRALIPSAREFVRIVDQLEQSHVMWQARYVSDIEQAITIGDRYVEKIQTQPPNSRPNLPPINLDV